MPDPSRRDTAAPNSPYAAAPIAAIGADFPLIWVRCITRRVRVVEGIAAMHGAAVVPEQEIADAPAMLVAEFRLRRYAPRAHPAALPNSSASYPFDIGISAPPEIQHLLAGLGMGHSEGCHAPGALCGSSVGVTPLRRNPPLL